MYRYMILNPSNPLLSGCNPWCNKMGQPRTIVCPAPPFTPLSDRHCGKVYRFDDILEYIADTKPDELDNFVEYMRKHFDIMP